MQGIINVLKPPGMTSHDVVGFIRKITGQKRVGHTGTLDPGAAGVLTVCVGQATGIIQYLPDDKGYLAEITFGVSTDTQDAYGKVLTIADTIDLNGEKVQKYLSSFRGQIQQIPPMASAVKHKGKKLYQLARVGIEVERPPRTIIIQRISLIDFKYQESHFPRAMLAIECSKGTYVRTICHDLGEKIGCGAHMSFLLRTRVGGFQLDDTLTLEEIEGLHRQGDLAKYMLTPGQALEHLPKIRLQAKFIPPIKHGNRIFLPVDCMKSHCSSPAIVRLEDESRLLALASMILADDKPGFYRIQPVKVFT